MCRESEKNANHQSEGQDQQRVNHGEKDAGLEVADRVPNLLPASRYLRPSAAAGRTKPHRHGEDDDGQDGPPMQLE